MKCPFNPNRVVQPGCTNAHLMRPGAPSLAIKGTREIGLFVAAISSLYIRLRYSKPLSLVKNLFALDHCHSSCSGGCALVTEAVDAVRFRTEIYRGPIVDQPASIRGIFMAIIAMTKGDPACVA